jgi:D-lactate dehydrogenase (cytochrome)
MITRRFDPDKTTRKRILKALRNIVGTERATDNPSILYSYSGCAMVFPKAQPHFVVRPRTTEEVQKVLAVARRNQVPVTPVASGSQEPSTYPWFGGIVLDTLAMDRIHRIDPEGGYALIEPGVTIGRLSSELEKQGLRCTVGSFPPGVSALGNYLMTAVNSHRTQGPLDDILGLEAVLADGTVMRTGSRAFSHTYPSTEWFLGSNSFPNLKNLFIDAAGTLGVVTLGAVRAYSRGESRTMPLSAFHDYPTALEYMIRLGRGNLVQHVCCWHWILYTIIDHLGQYGRGAPADVLLKAPWKVPPDRPYIVVVPSIAGFREPVEAAEKTAARITRELGGRIWTGECQDKWPGAWKFFADHYMDHRPTNQFMGGYGEGFPVMPIVIADPKRIAGLEAWGLKFLHQSALRLGLTYYSHAIDQGRAIFLRMTPFIAPESTPKEVEQASRVRRAYLDEAYKRYGAVPVRHDYGLRPGETLNKTGGHGKAVKAVKWALDPENILNPGMSLSIYGPPPAAKSAPKENKKRKN